MKVEIPLGQKMPLLIFATLIFQLIGKYYSKGWILWGAFDSLKFLMLLIFPVFLNIIFLKLSWRDLGLGRPVLSKTGSALILYAFILIPAVMYLILLNPDYLHYYKYYRTGAESLGFKLKHFSLFTASTLVGWEFFHRGLLLFGIRKFLTAESVRESLAVKISILFVVSSETLYHFLKPDLEAWGILFLSPILSWTAIRTKSLWLPLLIHLYIEFLFFFYLVV